MKKRGGSINKFTVFDIFNTAIMILLGLVSLFPLYYVTLISVANYADVQKQQIYIYPVSVNFEAYRKIFSEEIFLNAFVVTIFITVVGTLFSMFCSTAAAYTLSKKYVPGYRLMFYYILIPMFFGGGLIPYYLTIKNLHLIDKIWVMILPTAISSFYLIIIRSFFEDMPVSIEESAKIEGASDIYILYKIVIPTSAPVIATMSLFYAVDRWNDYWQALLFITSRHLYPLQLVLREIILDPTQIMASSMGSQIARSATPPYTERLQMAVIVVTTIPILCVYPFLQKHFAKGILFGAIKG